MWMENLMMEAKIEGSTLHIIYYDKLDFLLNVFS